MRKILSIAAALALFTAFSCAKQEAPEQNAQALKATATMVVGSVSLLRADQPGKIQVKPGMTLMQDDMIITGPGAKLHIVIDDRGVIQVIQNTRIVLSSLTLGADGSADQKIAVQTGKIILGLKKLRKDASFNVETPTAVAGVRGTSFMVDVEDSGNNAFPFFVQVDRNKTLTTKVSVLAGAVEFQDPKSDKSVMVNTLKAAILRGSDFDNVQLVNIDRLSLDMMREIKDFTEIKKLQMSEITEEISSIEPEMKSLLNTDLKTRSQVKKLSETDIQAQENQLKDDIKAQEMQLDKAKVKQQDEKKYIQDDSGF